jgi:3'-phosphoadenosine 5'-phosphosulfate sulfotransferase (PAPS reductase)/FAD synthetase
MDRILSFGAGVQTTALAIMLYERKFQVDAVVFADTGAEKPETYNYLKSYTEPLLSAVNIPFITVKTTIPSEKGNLYDFLWSRKDLPSIRQRRCTDHFKIRPIRKLIGKNCIQLIGFSADEINRAEKAKDKEHKCFPLIDMGMKSNDSRDLISQFGWPVPLKSSCYFCIYQPFVEWNWLKNNHPDLFQKALDLEANYHSRTPQMRNSFGLLRGTPLWRVKDGLQPEMLVPGEMSCWEGYCSH